MSLSPTLIKITRRIIDPQFSRISKLLLRKRLLITSKLFSVWCWTEEFLLWNWGVCGTELLSVWNWGVCGTEGFLVLNRGVFGVELRGFWCWTEEFLVWKWGVFGVEQRGVLKWGVFGVELRDFRGWKGVTLLCGTVVLNWGVWNWGEPYTS